MEIVKVLNIDIQNITRQELLENLVFGVHLAIVKKIPSAIMQAIICSTLMFVLSTAVSCFTYKQELKIVRFVKRVIDHSR